MSDYYEELGLSRSADLSDINKALIQLESTWKRREITNPEKATTMLALIIQARKVFANDGTRRKYDAELENSKKETDTVDPEINRQESLKKWIEKAQSYYSNSQYDLAKVAIEKALPLMDVNNDDDVIFALAADVYRESGNFDAAMNCINRAIVAESEVSTYYLSKGLIFDQQASSSMQQSGYGNSADLRSEARKMFHLAEEKAEVAGDSVSRARACGALALSYYFQNPIDKDSGERFANLAVQLGGDSWGNADKVLADIKRIQEENARRERENQKKREAEERRQREQIEAEKRAAQERVEAAKQKRTAKRRALIISLIAVVVIVSVPVLSLRHNLISIGSHVSYKFDENTGTLSIAGKGEIRDYPTTLLLGSGLNYPPWDQNKISRLKALCKFLAPIGYTRDDVKELTISDGITRIGSDVFSFPNITEVTIPSSVKSIGGEAFDLCSCLETVHLSNSIESIGTNAFYGDQSAVIYYDGTVFDWAEIDLDGNKGGFDLRGCYKIYCTDGSYTHVTENNAYRWSDAYLTIDYSGTMAEWNSIFTNPSQYEKGKYSRIIVICSDGEFEYTT